MIPRFNHLLDHVRSARYMLVRSGTSRIVILDGDQLRPGAKGHEDVLRIMLGVDGNGGLGGRTLQDNKVTLVWPEAVPAQFRFRVLQVIPSTREVLPVECLNSSSAAVTLAQLGGRHRRHESLWRAVNLSTGQNIELRPGKDQGVADAWAVRFLASPRTRRALAGLGGQHKVLLGSQGVAFHPVWLGNLFLFTDLDPARCDAEASAVIARAGVRVAQAAGIRPGRGYHPKVIPYRMVSTGDQPEVRAASYYLGELHRSFPGSAAMALCAYLAGRQGKDAPALDHWRVGHPSGAIDVRLGFGASGRAPRLEWTELVTPVSLLSCGVAAMPWRRAR